MTAAVERGRGPHAVRRVWARLANVQGAVSLGVLLVCGALVLYPVVFLAQESFNVGDPQDFPPTELGLANYADVLDDIHVIYNTAWVAVLATAMAVVFGFVLAWILTRTNVPWRGPLERLMELPYYLTPLVGALAWGVLAGPQTGLLNQVWRLTGASSDLFDIYTPFGVAWVMALFEGTVAFVMIAASMKSMDPSLEESSRVMGASKLRTMLKVTLPLVAPGVLGATVFVFAEMLGAFAAALVLGLPGRFFVITTAIWTATLSFPPDYGRAAAMGISLFGVMFATLTIYRLIVGKGSYATITGKAFRPRTMDMGRWRWVLLGICLFYVAVAVVLPLGALILTSFERFATVIVSEMQFSLDSYRTVLTFDSLRLAMVNSLVLGLGVATVGAIVMVVVVWIVYRSQVPGRGLIEYVTMFPQAVPRTVFGLALLWAWLNIPVPIYGTLWLLALAYFTVLLPLGVRTLAGVVVQIDRSLEECARVCGASWLHQLRTVTIPLLKPGILAAWLLLFMASVRELGVSVFLMGPNARVIAPSIAASWQSSSSELTAALAMIQVVTVLVALLILMRAARSVTGELR